MKLLTLNFLTCAIKDCKAASTATATSNNPPPLSSTGRANDEDEDNDDVAKAPRGPAFPLAIADATLERTELDFQPLFWRNIIPRVEWGAMREIVGSVGLALPTIVITTLLPEQSEEVVAQAEAGSMEGVESSAAVQKQGEGGGAVLVASGGERLEFDEETLKQLHELLLETQVAEGALVCRRCGHRYAIKEGIANFLLPPHLV